MYESIRRGALGSSSSSSGRLIWKELWKLNNIPPRVQTFLWRLLRNALPLRDAINKRIAHMDPLCPLCLQQREDANHLFPHCQMARQVWFLSPIGLRSDEHCNVIILLESWLTGNIFEEVVELGVSILWAIWKARCASIFRNEAPKPKVILSQAISIHQSYSKINEKLQNILHNSELFEQATESWTPPTEDRIKINIDGATSPFRIAAAAVARDSLGHFIAAVVWCSETAPTQDPSLMAELQAVHQGLVLAKCLQAENFVLEGDSQMVVRICGGEDNLVPWKLADFVSTIKIVMSNSYIKNFKFAKRAANTVADSFAKHALACNLNSVFFQPPSNMLKCLEDEYQATPADVSLL